MSRKALLILPLLLAGCASQPKMAETVWVTVAEIYTPQSLGQSFNRPVLQRFTESGYTQRDIEAGRLLRVACSLGTDYSWGSYATLPLGMRARKNDVLRLRIEEPTTDERMGLNPVLDRVEEFPYPGSSHAYRFIPDWKERNLFLNFERMPLEPDQRGRYFITHGSYTIKCRQDR